MSQKLAQMAITNISRKSYSVPLLADLGSSISSRQSIRLQCPWLISSVQKTRVGQIFHGFTIRVHNPMNVNDYFDRSTSTAYWPRVCISSAKALGMTRLRDFAITVEHMQTLNHDS